MASTYSDYKFELIGTGEQAGTWGNTTNTNIGTAIEQAIGGKADITMSTTSEALTLTDTNAAQDARAFYLNLTGTPGGAATLEVPAIEKPYVVKNATTGGYAVTVKVAGQTGVSIPNGQTKFLYNNGTDVTDVIPTFTGQGLTQASNTSLGKDSLSFTASGADNTGIGFDALKDNTSGYSNTAVGSGAAANITTGNTNSAFGWSSIGFSTTGVYNTGIGAFALVGLSSGQRNTAVGGIAGGNISSGSYNTSIGMESDAGSTGSYNTAVGYSAQGGSSGSNNTVLGYNAGTSSSPFNVSTNSNRVVVGDSNVTNAYIQVAWTVVSDARDKADVSRIDHGLNLITKLSPITFRWDSRSKYFKYDKDGKITARPEPDGSKKNPILYSGFLAQEVQQAIEEVGYPDNIIVDNEDPENLKIKETALIPVLVNAVKELKAEIDTLKAEIATFKGG